MNNSRAPFINNTSSDNRGGRGIGGMVNTSTSSGSNMNAHSRGGFVPRGGRGGRSLSINTSGTPAASNAMNLTNPNTPGGGRFAPGSSSFSDPDQRGSSSGGVDVRRASSFGETNSINNKRGGRGGYPYSSATTSTNYADFANNNNNSNVADVPRRSSMNNSTPGMNNASLDPISSTTTNTMGRDYTTMEAQRGRNNNNNNVVRGGRGGRYMNRGGSRGGRFSSMYGGGGRSSSSPRDCSPPDGSTTNTNSTPRSYSWSRTTTNNKPTTNSSITTNEWADTKQYQDDNVGTSSIPFSSSRDSWHNRGYNNNNINTTATSTTNKADHRNATTSSSPYGAVTFSYSAFESTSCSSGDDLRPIMSNTTSTTPATSAIIRTPTIGRSTSSTDGGDHLLHTAECSASNPNNNNWNTGDTTRVQQQQQQTSFRGSIDSEKRMLRSTSYSSYGDPATTTTTTKSTFSYASLGDNPPPFFSSDLTATTTDDTATYYGSSSSRRNHTITTATPPVEPKPAIPISSPFMTDTTTSNSDSILPSPYSNVLNTNSSAPTTSTYTAERKHASSSVHEDPRISGNDPRLQLLLQQKKQQQQQEEEEVPPKRFKVESPTMEDMSNVSSFSSAITTPPAKKNRWNTNHTPEYNLIEEPSTAQRETDSNKPTGCKPDINEQEGVSKQPNIVARDQHLDPLQSPKTQPNATTSMQQQHYSSPMPTPTIQAVISPSITTTTSSPPSLPPSKATVAFLRYMDALNTLEYTYVKYALACKEHENIEKKIASLGDSNGGVSYYDF